MEKEIKLNQWYFKVSEHPKFDNCQFKSTDLFYALEYHPQYDMCSGYFVSYLEFGGTEDFKKSTQVCFNDNKTLSKAALLDYEPISYKEAGEYIDGFTAQYFNLCN